MEPRTKGALLLVAVLFAAVVLPNLFGHRVTGQAIGRPLAPAPTMGDCVVQVTDPRAVSDEQSDVEMVDFPTAIFGPCDGLIVGEVATVQADAAEPARIGLVDLLNRGEACDLSALGYTGSIGPVVQAADGGRNVVWEPARVVQTTPIGPTADQRAAGQQWSACLVGVPAGQGYRGRLRDAFTTGAPPAPFGSCWASAALAPSGAIPCGTAHAVELLGITVITGSPDQPAVQRACAVYAARVLGVGDPTRKGQLRIRAIAPNGSDGNDPNWGLITPSTYWVCIADEPHGRSFNGSLIGIRSRPLPLV